jgi:uncharacterized membrane protein
MTLDEKPRMRQFWLRALLVVGLLWGGMPFLIWPLAFVGVVPAPLGLFAGFVNGITVAPACALAFWHRRTACIWLSLNAVVCVAAVAWSKHQTGDAYFAAMISLAGSVAIAVCLDWMEIGRWPSALGPVERNLRSR